MKWIGTAGWDVNVSVHFWIIWHLGSGISTGTMWYSCSSHQPFNSGAKRLTFHWLTLSFLWTINFGLYFCRVCPCKSHVLCAWWVKKFANVCLFQLSCYDGVLSSTSQVVAFNCHNFTSVKCNYRPFLNIFWSTLKPCFPPYLHSWKSGHK
jgi:hypothetical protein